MRSLLFFINLLFLFSACRNQMQHEFDRGEGDMLYKIHHDAPGPTIKVGDFMGIMMIEKTEKDSVIHNMYDHDGRSIVIFRDKSAFKGDLHAGFGILSEGDSATFKINADSLAKENGQPKQNSDDYRVYVVKIAKVLPRGNLSDSLMNAQIEAYRTSEVERAKITEAEKIRSYIALKKLKTQTTASGLQYTIRRKGSGATARPGDSLYIKYTGRYFSGKIFYTTDMALAKKSGIYNPGNKYGDILVIPRRKSEVPYSSFEEASMMFPKGTNATLIIPSNLVAGHRGKGMPAYAPLTAEMEILDIIPQKPAGYKK